MLLRDSSPPNADPAMVAQDGLVRRPNLSPLDARRASGLRRFGGVLLAYVLWLCGLSTLAPFEFAWPTDYELDFSFVARDALLNACMMFPIGFLYRMTAPRAGLHASGDALVLGLGLSALVESLQLLLPGRYTSFYDLALNALGCLAGAQLYQLLCMLPRHRLADRLLLRMPLANLFYLLTLQAWVAALGVGQRPDRLGLLMPLAACGALIVAAFYNHRLKHVRIVSPIRAAGFAGFWVCLCAAPAGFRFGDDVMMMVAGTAALTWLLVWYGFPRIEGRRFEGPTLAWLSLPFAAYLLALACRPWPLGAAPAYEWSLHFGLYEESLRLASTYDLVEYMAAFTVLGYAVAQAASRAWPQSWRGPLWAFAIALVLCGLLECVRGVHPTLSARVLALPLAALFASWGAAIYRAQLAVVRELLVAPQGASAPG